MIAVKIGRNSPIYIAYVHGAARVCPAFSCDPTLRSEIGAEVEIWDEGEWCRLTAGLIEQADAVESSAQKSHSDRMLDASITESAREHWAKMSRAIRAICAVARSVATKGRPNWEEWESALADHSNWCLLDGAYGLSSRVASFRDRLPGWRPVRPVRPPGSFARLGDLPVSREVTEAIMDKAWGQGAPLPDGNDTVVGYCRAGYDTYGCSHLPERRQTYSWRFAEWDSPPTRSERLIAADRSIGDLFGSPGIADNPRSATVVTE